MNIHTGKSFSIEDIILLAHYESNWQFFFPNVTFGVIVIDVRSKGTQETQLEDDDTS